MSHWEARVCYDQKEADALEMKIQCGGLVQMKKLLKVGGVWCRYGRVVNIDEEKGYEVAVTGDITTNSMSQRRTRKWNVTRTLCWLQEQDLLPIAQFGTYIYNGHCIRLHSPGNTCTCNALDKCTCTMSWRANVMTAHCPCIRAGIQCEPSCESCNKNKSNIEILNNIPELSIYQTKNCGAGAYCNEPAGIKQGGIVALVGGALRLQKQKMNKTTKQQKSNKKQQEVAAIGDIFGQKFQIHPTEELKQLVEPRTNATHMAWWHKNTKKSRCIMKSM